MKPSVQDATHYHPKSGMWYKFGEFTVYFWDSSTGGWSTSMCSRKAVNSSDFVTAQKALERGYNYPPYPTTTDGVIVDSKGSGEVLEVSETKVADESELQRKISEAISHQPYLTYDEVHLLRSNGYKVNSVGVTKMGGYEFTVVNEPLIPDMTEANDRKQRVNTSVTSANNRQVGGDHYKKMKIQPWDLFGSIFNLDEQIGFYLGNVYKYLMRYDSKNGIEDLMKAKHYLEKLIEVKRGAASADAGGK
jgi:hypothetical protein